MHGSHDWRASDFRSDDAPITFEAGVWVATQATVTRGVTVGRDTVIRRAGTGDA